MANKRGENAQPQWYPKMQINAMVRLSFAKIGKNEKEQWYLVLVKTQRN